MENGFTADNFKELAESHRIDDDNCGKHDMKDPDCSDKMRKDAYVDNYIHICVTSPPSVINHYSIDLFWIHEAASMA